MISFGMLHTPPQILDKAEEYCLAHFRLSSPSVEVQVRTRSTPFTMVVLNTFVNILTS
jgi:hypothetical protein